MIKAILVTFGYAESCLPASTVFLCGGYRFKNKFDALRELAFYLFKKYLDSSGGGRVNKCCKSSSKKSKYCSKCGNPLNGDTTVEAFKDWLVNTVTFSYDSWGYDDGWVVNSPSILYQLKKKDVLILDGFAENTLAYALMESDHDSEEWADSIKDNWEHFANFNELELNECLEFFKKQLKEDKLDSI